MSCVSNTFCLGGSLFCSGLLVDLNRTGDSLYQGGEFFAEIQRGVRPVSYTHLEDNKSLFTGDRRFGIQFAVCTLKCAHGNGQFEIVVIPCRSVCIAVNLSLIHI